MHISAILACIIATITVHYMTTKALSYEARQLDANEEALQQDAQTIKPSRNIIIGLLTRIKTTVTERDRHILTKEDTQLLAVIANTILFIAMAKIVNLAQLWAPLKVPKRDNLIQLRKWFYPNFDVFLFKN